LNLIAFESNQQMYAHTYSSQKQTSMQKTHSYLFLLVFVCVCQARVSASRAGHNSAREQVCGPASVTGSLNLCECVCVCLFYICYSLKSYWSEASADLILFVFIIYERRKKETDPTVVAFSHLHSSEAINEVLSISRHTLQSFSPPSV